MTEMDFIPGVIAQVRIGCAQTRDLEAVERSRVMALLIRMATGARDPLNGDATIVVVQQ